MLFEERTLRTAPAISQGRGILPRPLPIGAGAEAEHSQAPLWDQDAMSTLVP